MTQKFAKTMDLSGKQYAQVKDRLKEFLEANPKGKHESAYDTHADGSVVFTVWLWKDKSDLLELIKSGIIDKAALRASADGNGNAKGEAGKKVKDFEKLETIALGRALANVGYLASGEIASSEEMEEFEEYKQEQKEAAVLAWTERLGDAKDLKELASVWTEIPAEVKPDVLEFKNAQKVKLTPPPVEEPKPRVVKSKSEQRRLAEAGVEAVVEHEQPKTPDHEGN